MTSDSTDTRLVTLALVALGLLVALPLVLFGTMGFGPMMGGMGGHGMWGDGTTPTWIPVLGAVVQLLVLAVLVGVGYLFYRGVTGSDADSDRALEELRLAYARGELTDEEYENRRERLEREG